MALTDVFLNPIGLLALASVIPLILLYFLQPEPSTVELPTLAFLLDDSERDRGNPVFQQLRRALLLLIQLLALVLIATTLAAPYITIPEPTATQETVLVVDASASMATQTGPGGATRFDRAIAAARDSVTGTTSIVVSSTAVRTALRQGSPSAADRELDSVRVVDTAGDLRSAITQATVIADEDARILVLSDFVDASDWRTAVELARARGYRVDLRQFAGGGDNVGIVDRSFEGMRVTVSVKNFGDDPARREVGFAGRSRTLTLEPGDVATETFDVPPGGGTIQLRPGDSFPTDDTVPVTALDEPTVRVLVLTSDENRFLTTALSLVDTVDLTVESLPTTIDRQYDVIIFSNVNPDRLLQGNVETARETLDRGGGVAIQAQADLGAVGYGDLLLVNPAGNGSSPSVRTVSDDPMTEDITFSPPEGYVRGDLRAGRALVSTGQGTPLIATAQSNGGRVLYYGYIEDASSFKYNYLYPVFWKRAIQYLSGQPTLAQLNVATGERLRFAEETTVRTPTGSRTDTSIVVDTVGVYATTDREWSAALLSEAESDTNAPSIDTTADDAAADGTGDGSVARQDIVYEFTPHVAFGAIGIVLIELVYLKYRGDL